MSTFIACTFNQCSIARPLLNLRRRTTRQCCQGCTLGPSIHVAHCCPCPCQYGLSFLCAFGGPSDGPLDGCLVHAGQRYSSLQLAPAERYRASCACASCAVTHGILVACIQTRTSLTAAAASAAGPAAPSGLWQQFLKQDGDSCAMLCNSLMQYCMKSRTCCRQGTASPQLNTALQTFLTSAKSVLSRKVLCWGIPCTAVCSPQVDIGGQALPAVPSTAAQPKTA